MKEPTAREAGSIRQKGTDDILRLYSTLSILFLLVKRSRYDIDQKKLEQNILQCLTSAAVVFCTQLTTSFLEFF